MTTPWLQQFARWASTYCNKGQMEPKYHCPSCWASYLVLTLITCVDPLAHILERDITLVHPYSRNKSDNTDLIYFCCFCSRLVRILMVKYKLLHLSIILLFWAGKMILENKRKRNQVCVVRLIPGLKLFLFREYGPFCLNLFTIDHHWFFCYSDFSTYFFDVALHCMVIQHKVLPWQFQYCCDYKTSR